MSDPLAALLNHDDDPYGAKKAHALLSKLYDSHKREFFLESVENLMQRIVTLEMYLEEEKGMEISADELKKFREAHLPRIHQEVERFGQILFGSVAHKEGG